MSATSNTMGRSVAHKHIKARAKALMKLIKPYLDELAIGVECLFSWYWIADFCKDNGIDLVLRLTRASHQLDSPKRG
jgi:hypothetical protein